MASLTRDCRHSSHYLFVLMQALNTVFVSTSGREVPNPEVTRGEANFQLQNNCVAKILQCEQVRNVSTGCKVKQGARAGCPGHILCRVLYWTLCQCSANLSHHWILPAELRSCVEWE